MEISRRNLLQGASAISILAAAPKLAEAGIHGSSGLVAPFGNLNVGLTTPGYANGFYPFINIWKMVGGNILYQAASTHYSMQSPVGQTDANGYASAFNVYCDSNGEQLSPMPSNINSFASILFQATGFPSFVLPQLAGQTLTVDWTGGANWQMDLNYNSATSSTSTSLASSTTSPKTSTAIPSDLAVCNQIYITFTNLGGGNTTPPQNIRVYLTNWQSKLNAGQTVDPDYVMLLQSTAGSLRFMDWMLVVNSTYPNSYATIPTQASNFWGQGNFGGLRGTPLSVIVELCNRTNKHPHFCFPANIISPKVVEAISMTNANPAHVTTWEPNTFVNGDLLIANSLTAGTSGSAHISPVSYLSSTFTCASPHGMVNGYPIIMGRTANSSPDSSTYPTGVNATNIQYACNVTSLTFQIANTQALALAGTNVVLSGPMVGTINVYLQANFNTYTVANATSTGFDLSGPGSDMSTWNAFGTQPPGGNIGNFASPIDLSYISTQVGLIASYFKANLNSNLVPIFEYSNEIWNPGASCFFAVNAQSIPFGENNAITGGYIMAACMKAVYDVYGGDHTRYRALLSMWPYFDQLVDYVTGVNDYLTANAPTLTVTDIFTTILSASNYQGAISYLATGLLANQATVTFGTNTIAFSGAFATMPIKLNTGGGGTLPSGLSAGVLGTGTFDAGSSSNANFPKGTISGTTLTADVVNGNIKSGVGLASPSTVVGTTIIGQLTSAFTAEATFTGTISGTTLTVSGVTGVINAGGLRLLSGSGVTAGTFVETQIDATHFTVNISQSIGPITMTTAIGGQDGTYHLDTSQTVSTFEAMVTGPYWTKGSGQIYWLVGTGPNFGLATTPGGSPISFTTAGVSGTNTATQCGPDVVQFLIDTSISNHNSSPGTYPTRYSYFNTQIGNDILDARWSGAFGPNSVQGSTYSIHTINATTDWFNYIYTNWTGPGKPLAGLTQTTYEGGNDNAIGYGSNFPIFNDATWRDFFFQQIYSAPTGQNMIDQVTQAKTVPGTVEKISQFLDINTFNYTQGAGTYGNRLYIGDNNLRAQGIGTANTL